MYAIVRRVNVQPGLVEESIQRIEQGLVPLVSHKPGFVGFYLVRVGEDTGISITIFETREQIYPLAQGPAEVIVVGEVVLHRGKAD
jgi:heme-degrading monooxygenase HmoA